MWKNKLLPNLKGVSCEVRPLVIHWGYIFDFLSHTSTLTSTICELSEVQCQYRLPKIQFQVQDFRCESHHSVDVIYNIMQPFVQRWSPLSVRPGKLQYYGFSSNSQYWRPCPVSESIFPLFQYKKFLH